MADFGVPTPNYSGNAGADWSWLGNLPDQFYRGSQQRQQYNLSHAFDKGVPTNPDGSPNYAALLQIYGRNGDTADIATLGGLAQQQNQQQSENQLLSNRAPASSQPAAPSTRGGSLPNGAPPASASASISTMRPDRTAPASAATGETVGVLVGTALRGNDKAPIVAANIAKFVGVDPGTPLTPQQLAKAQTYIGGYLQRNGLGELPGAGLAARGIRNDNPGNIEDGSFARSQPGYSGPEPKGRFATFDNPEDGLNAASTLIGRYAKGGINTINGIVSKWAPSSDGNNVAHYSDFVARSLGVEPNQPLDLSNPQARQAVATAMSAYENGSTKGTGAPQGQTQGQPIIPQVPLPKGAKDPQDAILMLDRAMVGMDAATAAPLKDWRDRIAGATKPMEIGPSTTYVDPRTGQTLYQGPYARGLQGESGATLDADAERYLASGTLPPNMGRGMQGAAQATAIRQRAEELAQDRGIDPATMPERWQQYKAHQGGIQYFTYGQGGRTIKSFDVLTDHLGTLSDAVGALKNGNMRLFNQVGQEVARQTGSEAPTDFDAIKSIVGDEVVKAVVGSGGALGDREEVKRALDRANSPQQLAGVIDSYRRLALGQLRGLQKQYQEATGLDDFDQHLSPGTLDFFRSSSARSSAAGVPKVASDADYDALPSGSIFIDPDGKKRRKP